MNIKSLIVIAVGLLFIACSKNDPSIGKWEDNIKLSAKLFEFREEGDSAIVTTQGKWWWINDVAVGDSSFYNFKVDQEHEANYVIADSCFYLHRLDAQTLFIKLDSNPGDSVRYVKIGLQAGDYFDIISIKQLSN